MPEFSDRNKRGKIANNIQPALAIAYHPKSGKYELGINKSGDDEHNVDLHDKLSEIVDSIKKNFKKVLDDYHPEESHQKISDYLDSLLGRDIIGNHAEVKAVSGLLNMVLAGKTDTEIEKFDMKEIYVAVIKTQGNGKLGHEFIRCPNCTLVLNSLGITPLTDNSDFLKDGKLVIKD
jgi:hypothetical protein